MSSDWGMRLMSLLGLFCMMGIAWLLSENRKRIPWRILIWGTGLQILLGIVILHTRFGKALFEGVNRVFGVLTAASTDGAAVVFGNLTHLFVLDRALMAMPDGQMVPQEPFVVNAAFAFNVLPVIIFVSAVFGILQHLGVIQAVVRGMAWLMRRTLKTSGAETFGAALLVFCGIESVSALGGYLQRMTRSEIFTIMTAFLATIAASVMVAYAGFGAEPGHLLAASLMSAPAAILIAKLMVPETETPETISSGRVTLPVESENVFDAAARGASLGLNMALNVGAMIIVFIGLIYLADQATLALTGKAINTLLGYAFRPLAFVMGVPLRDVPALGELLATKTVFNEFLAYQDLQGLIKEGTVSKRTITIATYALCGFANPGSLGILIGGLSAMVPERRGVIARMSFRALIGGTLAAFMTACVAGLVINE